MTVNQQLIYGQVDEHGDARSRQMLMRPSTSLLPHLCTRSLHCMTTPQGAHGADTFLFF